MSPPKAATDKMPTMARTASISNRVLPVWGATRRAARPKNFGAAGGKRKRPLQSDCSERPGRIPRAPAPAVENIPFNRENKPDLPSFPRPAENRADKQFIKRSDLFLNRFINLNCLKNAAKRPLSFKWRGGGVIVERLKKFMVYSLSFMNFFYPIPARLSIKNRPGKITLEKYG